VLQYRFTEQVTAKGCFSETSPTGKNIEPLCFPQNHLLGFVWLR
jgi:hypothetical protein